MRDQSSMQVARVTLLIILSGCLLTASQAGAQTEAELIAGAKKEGKVVFWSSMRMDDSKALAAGFEARYPFIKVDIFRAGGEQIVNRAMAEHLAGKTTYDVVNAFALKVSTKTRGCCRPMPPPRQLIIQRALRIPRIIRVLLYSGYNVIGYNTKQVSKAEAPKNWEDLLNPRWKSKWEWTTKSIFGMQG